MLIFLLYAEVLRYVIWVCCVSSAAPKPSRHVRGGATCSPPWLLLPLGSRFSEFFYSNSSEKLLSQPMAPTIRRPRPSRGGGGGGGGAAGGAALAGVGGPGGKRNAMNHRRRIPLCPLRLSAKDHRHVPPKQRGARGGAPPLPAAGGGEVLLPPHRLRADRPFSRSLRLRARSANSA